MSPKTTPRAAIAATTAIGAPRRAGGDGTGFSCGLESAPSPEVEMDLVISLGQAQAAEPSASHCATLPFGFIERAVGWTTPQVCEPHRLGAYRPIMTTQTRTNGSDAA